MLCFWGGAEVESESDALNKSLVLLSNCEDTCPEDTRTLSRVYTSLSNSHQTNSAVFPESSQQEFLNLSEELRYIMLFIAAVKVHLLKCDCCLLED